MNQRLDASFDARCACVAEDRERSLQARSALQGRSTNVRSTGKFRRLAARVAFGAVLALGAAAVSADSALAAGDELGLAPVASIEALPLIVLAEAGKADETASSPRDPNEVLQFGAMRVQRWIAETVVRAAQTTGVDPVYMMALADKESSFIPANKASTSSAEGLFQFISSTWLEMVRNYGAKHGLETEAAAIAKVKGKLTVADADMREHILRLRRDPYLSGLMAGEMMKRDRTLIERRIGRRINRSEFYLAHFLGADSAGKLMALVDDKPQQSAPQVFPAAAKANKSLFFAKDGRKTRHLSVAEVYEKIDGMIDSRIDRYESVSAKVSDSAKVADARF
ncbi:MAG TPA: transglycosylase SLT domain-containing protein [Microvirga sp.]|jgi:hypothetical protein|nr:transglycosylase SLT domain-containing protein [Microvirga sp.]